MGKSSGGVRGNSAPNGNTMSELQFRTTHPTLYGQIAVNGKVKQGMFKAEYNKYTNSLQYRFYTTNGNKGTGGFTMGQAYFLYKNKQLHTKPVQYIGR